MRERAQAGGRPEFGNGQADSPLSRKPDTGVNSKTVRS